MVEDYNELLLQFCYVCLFGGIYPLIGVLALISNVVEVWVDSRKLCKSYQRPAAARAAGITPTVMNTLQTIAVLGIVVNLFIICFNSTSLYRKVLQGTFKTDTVP